MLVNSSIFPHTVDNKSGKIIPGRKTLMRELSLFSEDEDKPKVSPQLQLAILQYLITGNTQATVICFIHKPASVQGGLK